MLSFARIVILAWIGCAAVVVVAQDDGDTSTPAVVPPSASAPKAASAPAPSNKAAPTMTGTVAPTPMEEMTKFPTQSPIVVPDRQPCYTNLTALRLIIMAKDPFTKEVFKLCPNTIFDMGFLNASNVCCINGPNPLWPRKYTTVQCGDDGSSKNNCTLRGGSSQAISFPYHYNSEIKTESIMKGLTFENGKDLAILLLGTGDVTFDDCIIKVRQSKSSALFSHRMVQCHLSSFQGYRSNLCRRS
jgi:hypothetical protein